MNLPTSQQQFSWAIQRLAQMQGHSLDVLGLHANVSVLDQPISPFQALMVICYRMGLVQPKIVKLPDRVHLPMLCHTAQLGWGVVLDRNPLGL